MTSIWNVGFCLSKPPKMHRPLHFNGLVPPGGQWEVHYFEKKGEKNSWLGPSKHSGYMLVVLLSLCGLGLTNVVLEIKQSWAATRGNGDCCKPCLMRSSAALDKYIRSFSISNGPSSYLGRSEGAWEWWGYLISTDHPPKLSSGVRT